METMIATRTAFDFLSTEYLIEVYEAGPDRLQNVLNGLTDEELNIFPFEGKWSVKQIAFHLVDSELVGTIRMRQVLTQSPDLLPVYNEKIWTDELKHQQKSREELTEALNMFLLLRKMNGSLLRQLQSHQWTLTGIHPQRGEMSLRYLLELYADHSERHIDQILARRRYLGKGVALPVLLEKRLY